MGANAQTSVPLFTAGEVLTAANQNLSAGTGVPVFATTVTRDAAFGGSGEKVLAEGQLAYIEADNVVQYYDGAAWATVGPASAGALTLISATTIGSAVSSVTVSDAFSATYDNYMINVSGGVASTAQNVALQLGATTAGYYMGGFRVAYGVGSVVGLATNNGSNFARAMTVSANSLNNIIYLFSPNLAKRTTMTSMVGVADTGDNAQWHAGFLDDATQYTAFTLSCGGTLTGGTIRVYGFANS